MSRSFSDWIDAYLSLVRNKTEAPETYHFWSAVSTIAGTLTRNVYIDEIVFKLYPNFYIVLAARPGVAKKTTTIDLCLNLLRETKPNLFGPDETNWPDLAQTMANRTTYTPIGSPLDLDAPHDVQCAITLAIGEFSTFLKPNDRDMINGLTSLWDSRDHTYIKSTKFSGVDHVQNPYINIIGATTAKWLRDNFAIFAGWGIASRIIFVHSDTDPIPLYRPSKIVQSKTWNDTRDLLKMDLEVISSLRGEFRFTEPADIFAEQWYNDTMRDVNIYTKRYDADPWVSDFLARKQIHVHKLAMVFSASRRDSLWIDLDDLKDAIEKIDEVQKELERVFSLNLTRSTEAYTEGAIFEDVKHALTNGFAGRAPKPHILNRIARYVDSNTADRILSGLLKRGLLIEETGAGGLVITLPEE